MNQIDRKIWFLIVGVMSIFSGTTIGIIGGLIVTSLMIIAIVLNTGGND